MGISKRVEDVLDPYMDRIYADRRFWTSEEADEILHLLMNELSIRELAEGLLASIETIAAGDEALMLMHEGMSQDEAMAEIDRRLVEAFDT